MEIELFICRSDNYGVLIRDQSTGIVAAIDAPEEKAIVNALEKRGWRLDLILITHWHHDHIEGLDALKGRYSAKVVAPTLAKEKLSNVDIFVKEGDCVKIGNLCVNVWEAPGHCNDHVVYYFAEEKVIFVGDVLFVMGCGRVFGSSLEKLFSSLQRIASLPDDTKIYCGHEYSLNNAEFACAMAPEVKEISKRKQEIETVLANGGYILPTTLEKERATNLFLIANNFNEFKILRESRNNF